MWWKNTKLMIMIVILCFVSNELLVHAFMATMTLAN